MNRQNPTIITDFLDAATCRGVRRAMDRGDADPAEILHDGMARERRLIVLDARQAQLYRAGRLWKMSFLTPQEKPPCR